jgi:hypothetical protein
MVFVSDTRALGMARKFETFATEKARSPGSSVPDFP